MELKKPAVAGTMESSDIMVMIRPNEEKGIEIDIQSDVKATFDDAIEATIREVLADFDVNDAVVAVVDKLFLLLSRHGARAAVLLLHGLLQLIQVL